MLWLIRRWWDWVGPHGPWGAAGFFPFMISIALVAGFTLPPLIWVLKNTIGPWWAYWLR